MTQNKFPELAVITAYQNPRRCARRLQNYRDFQSAIQKAGVTLYTAELVSGDSPFELDASDAMIQLRCAAAFDQKERLLNLLIKQLPREIRHILWMSPNVLFENFTWPERILSALKDSVAVQPFSTFFNLPKEISTPASTGEITHGSVCCYAKSGVYGRGQLGRAWAARRDFISRHGLYDANIFGSGELQFLFAAFLEPNILSWGRSLLEHQLFKSISRDFADHYLAWAIPFSTALERRVGWIDMPAYALYDPQNSGRDQSQVDSLANLYSPYRDVQLAANGCWNWMHAGAALKQKFEHLVA